MSVSRRAAGRGPIRDGRGVRTEGGLRDVELMEGKQTSGTLLGGLVGPAVLSCPRPGTGGPGAARGRWNCDDGATGRPLPTCPPACPGLVFGEAGRVRAGSWYKVFCPASLASGTSRLVRGAAWKGEAGRIKCRWGLCPPPTQTQPLGFQLLFPACPTFPLSRPRAGRLSQPAWGCPMQAGWAAPAWPLPAGPP